VATLETSNVAEASDGALVVFDELDTDKEKAPLIVRKSDGGFLYATTDLAAVDYRNRELEADRVLYVTDSGQSGHFKAVFAAARRAELCTDISLEHVPFGLVQGEDGKKFATRSGETVRLKDLLDEAEARSLAELSDREDEDGRSQSELAALAKVVGVGAVKYADLSLNRESNYKFSYGKMLSLSGNTAPYMLYGYARINGIRRKALDAGGSGTVLLGEEAERDLARHLALLSATIVDLERDLRPNALCDYLFELAQIFNRFYELCPVLKAESDEVRASRATLCAATAAALKLGLEEVLGIGLVDRL
jgi:arginyl-tRNA synthetase